MNLSVLCVAISLDTEAYNITHNVLEGVDIYVNAFGTNETQNYEASPINHVAPGKNIPSFFIVTRGQASRKQITFDFAQKLEQANVPCKVVEADAYTHDGVNEAIGDPKDTIIMPDLENYLAVHLR